MGCDSVVYAHIRQDKLEPNALKCMFIGYPKGVKYYNLWYLEDGHMKYILSGDVVFNEFEIAYKTTSYINKGQLDPTPKKSMCEVDSTDIAQSKQDDNEPPEKEFLEETQTNVEYEANDYPLA